MIDLMQSLVASPLLHTVRTDPGIVWKKDAVAAVDAPPDSETEPLPESRWTTSETRTGICGVVGPRVVGLPDGGYRLYYTQILPRPGFPAGANDYDHSTTRILSAHSTDGIYWTPEPGVRLSPQLGGAGDSRVVSSEVVPTDTPGRWRMYYECCPGTQAQMNSIRSAVSSDGGLTWIPEPGTRLEQNGRNYSAPRMLFLPDGRCRLYCLERDENGNGRGIISALSSDGGLTFQQEVGVRIAQDTVHDALVAFACEIICVDDRYVMYYAGYSQPRRAYILRAVSDDGLTWQKDPEPVLFPEPGGLDAAKCSEMCVLKLRHPNADPTGYRMLYEACDGTAENERGVWRIASATSSARNS